MVQVPYSFVVVLAWPHSVIHKRPRLYHSFTTKNYMILKALHFSQTVLLNSPKDKKGGKVMS
jgi:hypothetical protein